MALQHLRSSTANKRPTPGAMSDGQLALNTNLASPGLFFKDSNGDAIKVGPVHVGTTAPNVSPAGQAGNSKGEQWLDTSSSRYVFKIWDGTAWRSEDGEFVNTSGDLMTGALGIIAGAAATPGLYFSGDTNTGIYSPGADQVAISTAGQQSLSVASNGEITVNRGGLTLGATGGEGGQLSLSNPTNTGAVCFLDANTATNARLFTTVNDTSLQIGQISGTGGTVQLFTGAIERMRIRGDGNIAIGGTGSAAVTLYNQGTISGGTTAYGNFTLATIQSDVTAAAYTNRVQASTAAATFSLGNIINYSSGISAIGAGSSITNLYGYWAEASLGTTGAAQITSVFGFRSEIAAAANRWNFYAAGTAANYFAGNVGIGTNTPDVELDVVGDINITGGILISNIFPTLKLEETDGTSTHSKTILLRDNNEFNIRTRTSADVAVSTDYRITLGATGATAHLWQIANAEEARLTGTGLGLGTNAPNYRLEVARLGSDQAITGVDANTAILATAGGGATGSGAAITLAGGTASICGIFFGDTAAGNIGAVTYDNSSDALLLRANGAERMRIRSDGNVAIGGAGSANVTLYNQGAITGGVTAWGNLTVATVQSDVTSAAYGYVTQLTTAAAAFTLGNLQHFNATGPTKGAGSTITTQIGFHANANLTQATDNFGFYGNIASATGRWNFYAAGTAPNYFAGDLRVAGASTKSASATDSATAVTLTAASIIDGMRSGTPTANINYTLPTGANLDAAFQDLQSNQCFEWSVINRASVTFNITVVANTTHTVFGNMVTGPASSGRFLTRKTTTDTFVTYRIG